MSTIGAGAITHVAVDMNGTVIMPLDKFVALCALLGDMTPARYDWGTSSYTLKSDGNKPEFKLLTVTDIAKMALNDPE